MDETCTETAVAASACDLVDRIAARTSLSRRIAAERFELIDQLRVTAETETGASWTDTDDLAWRDLRAEVAAVLTIHERPAQAHLSAEDAVGAAPAVTGLARASKVDGETRTMAQSEADVFRDLMIDAVGVVPAGEAGAEPVASPAARRGVRPEVLVHVPVLTAMGRSDDGALLDGYGPIDADTARALCADAPGFVRVLTDPDDGAVLSFGRSTYRGPAELKRFLRVRDEVCRFVGCTRSATLCDIDHSIPWQEDGETVEANLAHLCRGHHRVKERRRWRIGHDPDGVIRWTSPTGKTYETKPARRGCPPRVGAPPKPMVEWLLRDTATLPAGEAAPF